MSRRRHSDSSLLPWTLSFLRPYRTARRHPRGAAARRDRPRRAAAVAARNRHRQRARSGRPMPEPFAGWLTAIHGGRPRSRFSSSSWSPACCCRSSNQFVSAYGTQVQVDTGQRMVYDLRRRLFEHLTGARPPPPHHHQHGGRRLPRRRRRVLDREPGHERDLPARDVDHLADGDVRHPAPAERDDRAAVAVGRAVPVPVPPATTCRRW